MSNNYSMREITMSKFFKRDQREKDFQSSMLKKFDLMSELMEAIHYLNPTASDEQVIFMGTSTLLAITDTTALSKAVTVATNEATKKSKEVSVLNDMFNAPTATTNNN